ncbi:MAG TPA: DHA2 family efflux MFS transporter permease subunit [Casimicrobiaceae bacterium]|nr:DHA2 family efflux MFS transporter permease subunit [Casimicrobiaceae bacterium]
MATTMVGTVSTILAATIVNVAFPAMIREFNIGHDSLQWVATGFLAATTTTMLATSWLVEAFGQRATFVATMAVFLAASLLGASSWNTESLIAARVLQGAAAGVMQPLAMIAVFEVFPIEQRGRAMGIFGFGVVLAPAVGPALGGVLMEAFGWRAIFLLSLPFCVAALPLGWRWLSAARASGPRRPFDWAGTLLLTAALVALLNFPVIGHRRGWLSSVALADGSIALALTLGFVAWQFRAPAPLLAVRLLARRGFRAALLVAVAYGLGLFGTTYLVPVFVQDIAGYGPAKAGNLLLAPGFVLALAIALAGRLTDRAAPRYVVAGGLACFALSSLLLAFATGATAFWLLALWLTIGRVGLGFIIPALNVGAVESLPPQFLGQASAAVNFARQLGGAVGVNLLAVLLDWRLSAYGATGEATAAFRDCFLVVTIAFAAAVIPASSIKKHSLG